MSKLPPLTVIPASAGAGKTYSIKQSLSEWVADGKVRPDRIVAVTFTEAGASELRSRIRAELLSTGRTEELLKLENSYITTIHGFGMRLLREFAFDRGSALEPRLLTEDEQQVLIRKAVGQSQQAFNITGSLHRFGYRYRFGGVSAEESFRQRVTDVVNLVRTLEAAYNDATDINDLVRSAVRYTEEKYGKPDAKNAAALTVRLHKAVKRLLKDFPESFATHFEGNKSATDAFRNDFSNLNRASDIENLKCDWLLWQSLRCLRTSKRGTELPEAYDALAGAVKEAADALPRLPGPLEDEKAHIEAIIRVAHDVLVLYQQDKREAGLVDYTDMIAECYQLLGNQAVLDELKSRVDCLIVDEFQDTNPLQFGFLWRLADAGVPTLVVGDLKQSIMGFQGADPRLFASLIDSQSENCQPLTSNWRSAGPLMEIVNKFGAGLFDDYLPLTPQVDAGNLEPLHVLDFEVKRRKGDHAWRASWLASNLRSMLQDKKVCVVDKRSGERRRLRGGDCAVLCPTHSMLAVYAEKFREFGFRVRMRERGWFESAEVQIACNAMQFRADPEDRHAALVLVTSHMGGHDLESALRQLLESGRIDDPLLTKLSSDRDTFHALPADLALRDVLSRLSLHARVLEGPSPRQSRANLIRLEAEAEEFATAQREALSSQGFYGYGVQTFLSWLTRKISAGSAEDNAMQPESVVDEDAIELVTWHASKGREWPVVAVCGMTKSVKPNAPDWQLGYTDFSDLSQILNKSEIRVSPKFAAPESLESFVAELESQLWDQTKRTLYVALTRSREQLILEWPAYSVTGSATNIARVFMNELRFAVDEDAIEVNGEKIKATVTRISTDEEAECGESVSQIEMMPMVGRRAIRCMQSDTVLTPDSVSPSQLEGNTVSLKEGFRSLQFADELQLGPESEGRVGTFVHRVYEVLGQRPEAVDSLRAEALSVLGYEQGETLFDQLVASVPKFLRAVNLEWNVANVHWEVPVLGLATDGSVVNGSIDCLLESDNGYVIIDHKSDRNSESAVSYEKYALQLFSYRDVLESQGIPVEALVLHRLCFGTLLILKSDK